MSIKYAIKTILTASAAIQSAASAQMPDINTFLHTAEYQTAVERAELARLLVSLDTSLENNTEEAKFWLNATSDQIRIRQILYRDFCASLSSDISKGRSTHDTRQDYKNNCMSIRAVIPQR